MVNQLACFDRTVEESSCDIYKHCYLRERVSKIKPYHAYKFEVGDIGCFDAHFICKHSN